MNTKIKKYAISDIHGCVLTFQELLNKIGYSKDDELFLLGDFINRGPNSKSVIDHIMALQDQGYNIVALKGNHEEMVFDSIDLDVWTSGAEETLQSFNINHLNQLDKTYLRWILRLKPYFDAGEFIFVHAGLNFGIPNPLEDQQSFYWMRDWYKSIDYDWLNKRKIIHGHIPLKKIEIEAMVREFPKTSVLNIDNGCYLNGGPEFGN